VQSPGAKLTKLHISRATTTFPRSSKRLHVGQERLYWSVLEDRQPRLSRIVQRHVLHPGELNGRQETSWRKSRDPFGQDDYAPQQAALFPEERAPVRSDGDSLPIVPVRLAGMSLRRPRQPGGAGQTAAQDQPRRGEPPRPECVR
jgi:hypothetical protein